jgi:hypothetical protein
MVTERSAQLQLTIDIDSDPITGSVAVGEGAAHQFRGWMELVAAIESARHVDGVGVAGDAVGVSPGGGHEG